MVFFLLWRMEDKMTDRFTKRRKEKRKKIQKIAMIAMIAVIVILLGVFCVIQFRQIATLQKEVNAIMRLDITQDQVDQKSRVSGSLADAEEVIKAYADAYVTTFQEVTAVLEDETLTGMLSEDNISTDGPDFDASKQWLKENRTAGEQNFTQLVLFGQTETAKQWIEDAKLNGLTAKLCEKYLKILQEKYIYTEQEFESARQQFCDRLDQKEQVLDFLIENQEAWECADGKLTFATQELANEYNQLVTSGSES